MRACGSAAMAATASAGCLVYGLWEAEADWRREEGGRNLLLWAAGRRQPQPAAAAGAPIVSIRPRPAGRLSSVKRPAASTHDAIDAGERFAPSPGVKERRARARRPADRRSPDGRRRECMYVRSSPSSVAVAARAPSVALHCTGD